MDNITWNSANVDYYVPGEYVITYSLLDEYGETLNTTELYVIVEEN